MEFVECEHYGGIAGVLRIFCKKESRTKYESECRKCFQEKEAI
jgi:hypothetical protein